MGETPCPGCPPPSHCCLDVHDTLILLVVLSVLVQVVLQVTLAVGTWLWRQLKGISCLLTPTAPPSPPPAAPIRKSPCPAHPPTPKPRRDLALLRPCPLCPRQPLQLTMDVNLHRDPSWHHHEAPAPFHNCTCPHATSSPTTLHQDAGHPRPKPRATSVSRGTNTHRVPGVRFRPSSREEVASSGAESQRPRPTKVYIYPVHPETPPTSRDPSPSRQREGVGPPAGTATQSRDAAVTMSHRTTEMAQPGGRVRYLEAEEPSMEEWVYRPIRGPQWKQTG